MKNPDMEHIGAIAEREFKEFRITKRQLKKVEAIEMVRRARDTHRRTRPSRFRPFLSLFATGESMGGTESDSRSEHSVTIEDKSCDLVIMNPPFTRSTNHEAGHAEIPVPSFAGFNTSHDEQQAMGRELKKAGALFSSGHAGGS